MISTTKYRFALLAIFAVFFSLATSLPAAAQEPPADDETEMEATESAVAPDSEGADILKDIDVSKLDWSQLNPDPLMRAEPTLKDRAAPKPAASADAAWSSNPKPNGAAAVSVRQSVSPFLDTRIGADMTIARQGTLTNSEQLAEKLANGGSLPQSSGTAWAAITAPGVASIWDKTSVEARIDPTQEQSNLGTSLSKSVPFSEQYSLTLQNGYNLIQQGIVPVPGIISHPARSFATDQSATLSLTDTGTSLIAGQSMSSSDDKWLRKIGAEQKLFDGVTVSGSIGETPQGPVNKSITAGFKRSW